MSEAPAVEAAPIVKEMPRWARAAVTASAPLWAWLPGSVAFGSIESELGGLFNGQPQLELTVGALGISALFTASAVVEVGSFVHAPWRAARLAGPAALVPRLRVTVLLALVVATFQAWGLAKLVDGSMPSPGLVQTATTALTLVAGFALSLAIAAGLGRWGLANGALTLVGGGAVLQLARKLQQSMQAGDALAWRPPALVVGTAVASALLVWMVSRIGREPATRPAPGPDGDRAGAPPLAVEVSPAPAGLLPVVAAASFVSAISYWGDLPIGPRVLGGMSQVGIAVVLALAVGAVLARPSTIARLWARAAGRSDDAELQRAARAATNAAIARGAVFALAAACIELVGVQEGRVTSASPIGLGVGVAVVTAVAIDAARAFRARGVQAGWVLAWTEPRPDAAPAAIGALRRVGIPAQLADATCAWLFPLVGPVAPTVIMVPSADAERARDVLAGVLSDDSTASGHMPSSPAPIVTSTRGALVASSVGMFVIAAAAVGLIQLAAYRKVWDGPPPPRATLKLRYIEDDIARTEPFRDVALLEGGSLQMENAPLGGHSAPVSYVRVVPVQGETVAAALPRARKWLKQIELPPNVEVGWGPWEEFNEDTEALEQGGWRTYILAGSPVVTERHLVDAMAVRNPDPYAHGANVYVALELSPDGGERFAEATRKWTQRRLAILVDDQVLSAPVIMSEIRGGRVQITMGDGDPDQRYAEAQRLAAALNAGRPRSD